MAAKIRLLIGVVGLVTTLMFQSAGLAFAGTQGECSPDDTTKAELWENAIGDTGDNNDILWKCSADSDLSNDTHVLPGNCANGTIFGGTTWNDCVSSYKVWVDTGVWCFFRDANYGGFIDHRGGTPQRFDLGIQDVLSSLRIETSPNPDCNI